MSIRLGLAVALIATFASSVSATPQSRTSKEKDASPTKPPEAPFRVVEVDGTMRAGRLVLRGAGFLVEKDSSLVVAADDASGEAPGGGRGDEGEPPAPSDGGGGAGGGGGRAGGGGRGGGGNPNDLGLEYMTKRDGPLARLERVEQEQKLLFQATRLPFTAKYVSPAGYSGGYGGLTFALPSKDWQFLEASVAGATVLRRDQTGDIIGRIRLWVLTEGDGTSANRPLDLASAKPAAVFRKLDRQRFTAFDVRTESDEETPSGVKVRRIVRSGTELVSGVPCHLEANIPSAAPFFPVFEILARGPQKDAIVEECRLVLDTLRFTEQAVGPMEKDGLDVEEDGGGALKPRDLMSSLQSLATDAVSEYVVKGKYENPWLGINVKSGLPEGWVFYQATLDGFAVAHSPAQNAGWFDLGFGTLGVLEGKAEGKEGAAWVLERYIAGLPPTSDPKDAPKPKKGKLGTYSTREFVHSAPIGNRNNIEAAIGVQVIENGNRTVCVMRLAVGQGNQPPQRIDEIQKWLKALSIQAPKPKPAE